MLEETSQEGGRALTPWARGIRSPDPRRRQCAPDRIHRVVVELVILLGRALPISDIRLVPDLPQPRLHLCLSIALHAVSGPLKDEFGPLLVILGRVGPTRVDIVVVVAWLPGVAVRLGVGR